MALSLPRGVFYIALGLSILYVIISTVLPSFHVYNKGTSDDGKYFLAFDIERGDLVAISISDTTRYDLSDDGSVDYASLMPTGGHTVHVSTSDSPIPQTFTVALFHQLKCLEIYHREYLKPLPRQVTPELRGCLDYLRQSLLCHADTRLESVKNREIQASKQYDTICRDWTKVYEAAERNYNDYQSWAHGGIQH
jgi:hypothetical protein